MEHCTESQDNIGCYRLQSIEWKREVVCSCEEPNPCRQLGCVPVSAESSAQVAYSLRTSLLLTFEQFSNHMLGGQFNQYYYNIETAVLSSWGLLLLLRMLCSLKGQDMTPCVKRAPHFGEFTSNPGLRWLLESIKTNWKSYLGIFPKYEGGFRFLNFMCNFGGHCF